ncbi:hypothetical protein [Lysobacter gummosus]
MRGAASCRTRGRRRRENARSWRPARHRIRDRAGARPTRLQRTARARLT